MPLSKIVQDSVNGGVAGTGPAFSAYASGAQTLLNQTFTKIAINTEEFDTNNNYDKDTNYRFQPTVAGYYQVNGSTALLVTGYNLLASIFKNSAEFKRGNYSNGANSVVSTLIYFNGSTDYVELFAYQGSGGSLSTATGNAGTYFQASMVRAA